MIVKRIERRVSTAKKRVAAYCRVSTQRNEQEESFETQKAYYEELICRNPDWELVKIYSDKHSATSVKNRPGFQEMMADAKARKIDILLVKSISRFARNVVDCQQYLQKLESYGVCVQFEKENIRTDDPTSGFVLSLLSAVAQDESHSISKNVQLSYESRFKRGEYNLGNNRILGYDCIDGELVPNQDAWIVKEVFCRFLEGQTYREIREGLAAKGARTLHGKTRFSVETIRYMLGNESYVGDIPDNIHLFFIPPYTPEMNPIEQIWKEIRLRGFRNQVFPSLNRVVDRLCETIRNLSAETIQSISGRQWIVGCFD